MNIHKSKKALKQEKNKNKLIDFNETVCYAWNNVTKLFSKKNETLRN